MGFSIFLLYGIVSELSLLCILSWSGFFVFGWILGAVLNARRVLKFAGN